MTHSLVEIVAIAGCACSCGYYVLCLASAGEFLRERKSRACATAARVPVSILKPLKGADPQMYEAFRSHCLQDYPEYEIIFGVSDAGDPAIAGVKQLQAEFPDRAITLVVCPNILGPNVKVSNLAQMVQSARHEHLLVNDSDIRVEPDYLSRVFAPFADEKIGMVTCLYRGVPMATPGSKLESLGISTDFIPGVLAAKKLQGIRFGLGSTLAFRRRDLDRIGGFRSIVDFLADDYELGAGIAGLGLEVQLSDVTVETHLPAYDLSGYWLHQLRWARAVRDARRGGYFGLIFTFGLLWALLAVIAAPMSRWAWLVAVLVVVMRVIVALRVGKSVLQDGGVLPNLWLMPLRDLLGIAVWLVSLFGSTVVWRGQKFTLKNGRLRAI